MTSGRDRLGPELKREVGSRIRTVRGPMALETLAGSVPMSAGTLGRIERGEGDMTLGVLLGLVRALGLSSIEELIGPLPELPSADMARRLP